MSNAPGCPRVQLPPSPPPPPPIHPRKTSRVEAETDLMLPPPQPYPPDPSPQPPTLPPSQPPLPSSERLAGLWEDYYRKLPHAPPILPPMPPSQPNPPLQPEGTELQVSHMQLESKITADELRIDLTSYLAAAAALMIGAYVVLRTCNSLLEQLLKVCCPKAVLVGTKSHMPLPRFNGNDSSSQKGASAVRKTVWPTEPKHRVVPSQIDNDDAADGLNLNNEYVEESMNDTSLGKSLSVRSLHTQHGIAGDSRYQRAILDDDDEDVFHADRDTAECQSEVSIGSTMVQQV